MQVFPLLRLFLFEDWILLEMVFYKILLLPFKETMGINQYFFKKVTVFAESFAELLSIRKS